MTFFKFAKNTRVRPHIKKVHVDESPPIAIVDKIPTTIACTSWRKDDCSNVSILTSDTEPEVYSPKPKTKSKRRRKRPFR
jgi:hypothetical protein